MQIKCYRAFFSSKTTVSEQSRITCRSEVKKTTILPLRWTQMKIYIIEMWNELL